MDALLWKWYPRAPLDWPIRSAIPRILAPAYPCSSNSWGAARRILSRVAAALWCTAAPLLLLRLVRYPVLDPRGRSTALDPPPRWGLCTSPDARLDCTDRSRAGSDCLGTQTWPLLRPTPGIG